MMNRLVSAFLLMFRLPAVWIAMAALAMVVAVSGSEPLLDIAVYALRRLL